MLRPPATVTDTSECTIRFTFYLARCPQKPSVFLPAIYAEFGARRNAQCEETCFVHQSLPRETAAARRRGALPRREFYFSNDKLLVTHSIWFRRYASEHTWQPAQIKSPVFALCRFNLGVRSAVSVHAVATHKGLRCLMDAFRCNGYEPDWTTASGRMLPVTKLPAISSTPTGEMNVRRMESVWARHTADTG
jgi:hypothetical protein